LKSDNPYGGLKSYLNIVFAQLNQIVNKVREKMPDLLRMTFSSLIVLEVHAKDVLYKLCCEGVMDVDDFNWIG
jgi:dynein heavy chain